MPTFASTPPLRIACAAGFSGDRTDAASPLVDAFIKAGGPSFLIFETLAERTLALAQLARRADPAAGFEPLLADMLRPVLARCLQHGIRIVSNFGAANPQGAARRIAALAAELGLQPPRIAVVGGDDLSHTQCRAMLEQALRRPRGNSPEPRNEDQVNTVGSRRTLPVLRSYQHNWRC